MNKTVRFLQTAGIYLLGNVLSKLVSFFLLPLYTNCINPDQYGSYDLIITILNMAYPIVFFQIWDSMFRFAFDYSEDEDKYSVINNSIFISFIGALIYIILAFLMYKLYKFDYFFYILILGLVQAICYIFSFSSRVFLNNKLFVFSGAVNTIVNAVTSIILIVALNWDIKALYFAPIVGSITQIIIIEIRLGIVKHIKLADISKVLIYQMLKFSIPLCIATASYWLLSGFSKVIITNYLGSSANAMYAVTNRFASMITLFVSIFQYAWNESAYLMHEEKNRTNLFSKCINLFSKVIIYGTGATISFIMIIFPFFIGNNYNEALGIIPTSFLGVAFNSVASFLATLFMTEKKTNFVLTSTLIAAMFNVILSIPFTNALNLQGTIIALDISFFILMMLRFYRLNKTMKISINRSILISCTTLVITIVVFYFGNVLLNVLLMIINIVLVLLSARNYIIPIYDNLKRGK